MQRTTQPAFRGQARSVAHRLGLAAVMSAGLLAMPSAKALLFTFDLGGLGSMFSFATAFPTATHDFGLPGTVTGVNWNVTFEAFFPSWRNEARIAIDTDDDLSLDADFHASDYGAPNSPGLFSYAGAIPGNSYSSNGRVHLTLYESFADGLTPDALYSSGSYVQVEYTPVPVLVPETGTVMAGLGLSGLLASGWLVRRHRRP